VRIVDVVVSVSVVVWLSIVRIEMIVVKVVTVVIGWYAVLVDAGMVTVVREVDIGIDRQEQLQI
jgi:hypothetical protein